MKATECVWMSFGHVSVTIPPLAADQDGSNGENTAPGVEQCCSSEPHAAESEASLPVPLRHLRDLQKLFAERGLLVQHKWMPAVRPGSERSLPPWMGCAPWGSWPGWQDVPCLSIPGRHIGTGAVKGRQCFPPEVSLGKQTQCFFPSEGKT